MIYGLVAIICWILLLGILIAFVVVVAQRNRAGIMVLSAFLLGGSAATAPIWAATRPDGLPFRESLKAGLTDEGLRKYGHPIEHRAEIAICLSTYGFMLGGGLSAGVFLLGRKARRRN
jgi:hypothetical protein